MDPNNPQASMMADESMLRTLAAQAAAIWPQERGLLDRYWLAADCSVLDAGCGSGEFASRLASQYPQAQVIGVDVLESSIAVARERHAKLAARLHFEQGDAFALRFADASFDLVACRHVTQSVPQADRLLAELLRVTRPGGWLHVLSEDYSMLQMMSGPLDPDRLWRDGPVQFAAATGTDARIGRKTWSILKRLGLVDLRVDYVIVDTLRVDRQIFADIMIAWRDGYAESLAAHSAFTAAEVRQHFDEIIQSIRDANDYAVWFVPVVSGQRPFAA